MAYAYWVIAGLWLLWAAYWMASARRTKQSDQAEERWLVRHLGEEYSAYQRKVRRLIPFLW
jgi:protein-S-isoprenylcysteine O-methyltransferase Ste14